MRNRYLGLIIVLVAVVVVLAQYARRNQPQPAMAKNQEQPIGTLYRGAGTQTITGALSKMVGGEEDQGGYHILAAPDADKGKPFSPRAVSGVWELNAGSDITETVSSRVPPMTAKGKAMFALTRPGRGPRAVGRDQNDADDICDPLGWPRILYQPIRPVEFITLSDRQLQHWAWRDQWRTIWTDGRKLPKDPDPLWYGYSVGSWENDKVFHEITNGEDDRTWLSMFGNVHSLSMIVDAVWRRLDHNTMTLNIVIKDPEVYTEDWIGEIHYFHLLTDIDVDPLPCAGSEEVFYRDQMRANYPKDEEVHAKAPKDPKVIVSRVALPNTGVGFSRVDGAASVAPSEQPAEDLPKGTNQRVKAFGNTYVIPSKWYGFISDTVSVRGARGDRYSAEAIKQTRSVTPEQVRKNVAEKGAKYGLVNTLFIQQPIVILEPADKVAQYAGQQVWVTGTITTKALLKGGEGGRYTINVTSIEPHPVDSDWIY